MVHHKGDGDENFQFFPTYKRRQRPSEIPGWLPNLIENAPKSASALGL